MLLNCDFCKKEIPYPHHRGKKYCNAECSYEAMKLRQNKKANRNPNWNKEKMCILCDKKFTPAIANQKYCSRVCCKNSMNFDYVHKNFSKIKDKIDNINLRWLKVRIKIFDRDNFTCQYCGRSPMNKDDVVLHIDHKIPKNKGGTDDIDNLITSCSLCNLGKSDLLLKYWENKRKTRPLDLL